MFVEEERSSDPTHLLPIAQVSRVNLGYGRFLQTDPSGYDDGLNWYNYVGGDPVNATDPSGSKLVYTCVEVGGQTYCGYRDDGTGNPGYVQTVTYSGPASQQPADTIISDVLVVAKTGKAQPQKPKKFTCADALKQPGNITTAGISVTGVFALGLTTTRGSWFNTQTGASGKFTTIGFVAGLAVGGSVAGQTYSNIRALSGWSDGYTIGATVPIDNGTAIGGSYSSSWNDSGSGSGGGGGNYDVSSSSVPFAGYAANFTDTTISQCKAGN